MKIFLSYLMKHPSILIVLILGGALFITQSRYEGMIDDLHESYQEVILGQDSTITEYDGVYTKYSATVKDAEAIRGSLRKMTSKKDSLGNLNQLLKSQVSIMLKEIERKNENLKGAIAAELEWKDYALRLEDKGVEVIFPSADTLSFNFQHEDKSFKIYGTVWNPPAWVDLNIERKPVTVVAAVTELRKGLLRTHLTFSDPQIQVSNIDTRFIPFKENLSFLGRLKRSLILEAGGFYHYYGENPSVHLQAGMKLWRFRSIWRASSRGFSTGVNFNLLGRY